MKVLSLFDGMACGMLAMIKTNIPVERYVAYEIDKYAVQTSSHNFPKIEHKGDVFQGDFTEYKDFDYLIGGSPCTYWSICQKPDKREKTASGIGWELFMQYVRALKEAQPKFFVYENNYSMSKEVKESISEAFGFEPIMIDAALVSAQSRKRLYWVGKRIEGGRYEKVKIEQPEDRGILLKDILKSGICERKKGYCLKHQAGNARDYFKKHHSNIKFVPVGVTKKGKSYTLTANYKNSADSNYVAHTFTKGCKSLCAVPINETTKGKSKIITSSSGGYGAKTGLYARPIEYAEPIEFENGKPIKAINPADGKEYKVFEVRNSIITIKGKEYPFKADDGFYIIVKLTVDECKILQTVPLEYEFPVSDTQAYKMLGNGWCVDCIVHLLEATKEG